MMAKSCLRTTGNRSTETDRFISFSMAKSITSLLIGIALEKGYIQSLDDPAGKYVPELNQGAYGSVTIRQLLQMRVRCGIVRNATISARTPAWRHWCISTPLC